MDMMHSQIIAANDTLTPTLGGQDTRKPALSAFEWSVVAIARNDSLSSLNEPSRLSIALGTLFGGARRSPRLADSRLEALRRMAVLAWHKGFTIANTELRTFLAAGFSMGQYELLQRSIGAARLSRGEGVTA